MSFPIEPIKGIRGLFSPPGDKSISHRAIILASLAQGTSNLHGLLEAEDTRRTLEAFQALGVKIQGGNGSYQIKGRSHFLEPEQVLDMGNSGTGLRLLTGLLAGEEGCYSVLTGDSSLTLRPMDRIILPLQEMGAAIWGREKNTRPPLSIKGRKLCSFSYSLPIPSAQVKSALLLAGLGVNGQISIAEPIPCRDHTEVMLSFLGVPINRKGEWITLSGPARPRAFQLQIPGDISSAAFLVVLALITPASSLQVKGVGLNPTRSAFLQVLQEMGGQITIKNTHQEAGEPVGEILVRSSSLQGTSIQGHQIPLLIDEIPALAVAAVYAQGETWIKEAEELRFKESDRIRCLVQELTNMGGDLEEFPDGMRIMGQGELKGGATCSTYQDHRMGMALAVAGLASKEGVFIQETDAISTSFPHFFSMVDRLRKK